MSSAFPQTHFISGEPGTTGREPFDESTSSGAGNENAPTSAPGKPNLTGANHQQNARDHGLDIPVIGGDNQGMGHNQSSGYSHGTSHHSGVDNLTAGSGAQPHGTSRGHTEGNAGLVGSRTDAPMTGKDDNRSRMTTDYGVGHSHAQPREHRSHEDHSHEQQADSLVDKAKGAVGLGSSSDKHNSSSSSTHDKSHFSNDKPTRHTNENEYDQINQQDRGERERVGAMGQESSRYEGKLGHGPTTTGAAGTDRFDSDRTHSQQRGENVIDHDTSQRAPGVSGGGIGGALGTSDKDFVGRERQGKGAYADTDGTKQLNTSGPAGHTALTGREGNLDNNPVADRNAHNAHSTSGQHTEQHGEKKGLMQKVKDAIM